MRLKSVVLRRAVNALYNFFESWFGVCVSRVLKALAVQCAFPDRVLLRSFKINVSHETVLKQMTII